LLPMSLIGSEELSHLFNFDLELLAPVDAPVSHDRILGRTVTAELRQRADSMRYFNGIIAQFGEHGRDPLFIYYRARMVPKLWLLTRTRRCRIFQHLSTPEILSRVLD